MEHTTISQEQSQRIIAAAQGNGSLCLARIASHNMEMIKRLLDSGADGIIVPMVETKEEIEDIIKWSKFPPVGKRSYGISRAQGYGFDFDKYVKTWNSSSIIIAQIESIKGVENIESILSSSAVNGIMVGPYDLSGSLNIPGKLDDPKVKKAEQKVIKACVKYNKSCGTHIIEANMENVKKSLSRGYNLSFLSSDIFILWKWSEQMKSIMNKAG